MSFWKVIRNNFFWKILFSPQFCSRINILMIFFLLRNEKYVYVRTVAESIHGGNFIFIALIVETLARESFTGICCRYSIVFKTETQHFQRALYEGSCFYCLSFFISVRIYLENIWKDYFLTGTYHVNLYI